MRAISSQYPVLISGASSGIGLATAHYLKARGYEVLVTARKQEDVDRLNQDFTAFLLDISQDDHIARVKNQVLTHTQGRLGALFNNAGFGVPGALADMSREALSFQFATNVFGSQMLTNAFLPHFLHQGFGQIIYNSSVLGFAAMPFRGPYNASKYALEGLADTLRLELKDTGVKVILIEPGPIHSQFRQHAYENFLRFLPAGKRAESYWADAYDVMIERFHQSDDNTAFSLPSEAVAKVVYGVLQQPSPKARYRVTLPTKVFALLKRILPTRWLDPLLILAVGNGKR